MMRPLRDVRLSVILDRPEALYSGMVPGLVAAAYPAHALEIDVVPLARRSGARVVLAAATRVDPAARRIELEGRPPLAYDVASLDVGSSVHGLDLPGVREHAVATRPIGRFTRQLDARLRALAAGGRRLRIAVVGGGAAGVELACALRARLGPGPGVCLVSDAPALLPERPDLGERARQALSRLDIVLCLGRRVARVEKDALWLEGGADPIECQLAVWATGAAAPDLVRNSPLPRDERGFVRVGDSLAVTDCEGLFAAGDCASLASWPELPKAGVYAVREGPVLDANLRSALAGRPLRAYRPQRDFLALLNLGNGRALGARSGRVFEGRWVFRLKDRIDRRFMRRFQVLDAAGRPARGFPRPGAMGDEPMTCGGCAAKLGAEALAAALDRLDPPLADARVVLGLDPPDDSAALRQPGGGVLLASIDAFRAFTDDPWLVGRVAAVNAASDVLAKGGRPRHALALVGLPPLDPPAARECLFQVMAGIRAGLDPLGISLVGGHTTATATGADLFVGLTITGELEDEARLLRLDGARPGDVLVLSKPLGTGVVLAADMQGRAAGRWVRATHASLCRSNAGAAEVARRFGATACTDVSGFGLALHLDALLRASGVGAELELEALPALPGAAELLAQGVRSTFHPQNQLDASSRIQADPACEPALLYDPQTSGGLLFSLPAEHAGGALDALRAGGDARAAAVGRLVPEPGGRRRLRVR